MRYFMGSIFVLVLGVMGCSETSGTPGGGGAAGVGGGLPDVALEAVVVRPLPSVCQPKTAAGLD